MKKLYPLDIFLIEINVSNMKKRLTFLLFILCFSSVNTTISQTISSNQIDSLVLRSMDMMPQAGVAVAVVKDGKVVHAKGYGITSISTEEKVDENTLFAIASNSKSFTTAALAMLVDDGKLQWTDKVVDHIPEFKMYDPYVTAHFNIIDLLTHRSGLGLGAGDLMFFPDSSDFTVEDVLQSFQYQKPLSAFRTKYDYDNLLYIVAGEVVARVSGIPWTKFVENRIMKPIGMIRSAGVYQNLTDKKNVASPHSSLHGKLVELEPYTKPDATLGSAGGIYSSVQDMSKWLLVHLNKGRYGQDMENQLFSEKSQDDMWRPYTQIRFNVQPDPHNRSHFSAYGLGWGISDQNGFIIIGHTGGLPGMLSRTVLIPELNAGLVVLTNADPGGYSYWTISSAILEALIGVEKKDWLTETKKQIEMMESRGDSVLNTVWDIVEKSKVTSPNPNDYIGTYRDNWFGDVEIWLDNQNELWFRSLRSPKLTGRMHYYQANTFAIKWNYRDMPCDAFAMFNLDETGKAISISMKAISPHTDFSFDFHDLDLRRVIE